MKLRAAVIGVGYLGRFHAQKYKALSSQTFSNLSQGGGPVSDGGHAPSLELVGVCDPHFPQAELVARELGVQAFDNPESLIGKVDLVTIAASTLAHASLGELFLSKGVHVLMEKPICADSASARKLIKIAQDRKLVFQVGHSERMNPAFQNYLKRQASQDSRDQGVQFLEAHRMMPFQERTRASNVVTDLMIHDIDLVMALVGSTPKVVSASGGRIVTDQWDWAQADLEFSSGQRASLVASRVASDVSRQLKVFHANQICSIDFQTGVLEVLSKGVDGVALERKEFGKADNLLAETQEFVQCVSRQEQPQVTAEVGLEALLVCESVLSLLGRK